MKGILGKKIGMTQVYTNGGKLLPTTVVDCKNCQVLQVKDKARDGYSAVRLGLDEKKESGVNKPDMGDFKKAGVKPKRFIREITIDQDEKYKAGQEITVDIFAPGEFVDVTGVSIGKGFQGGIKRWHWKGGPKTHGSMSHRSPGSIGASSDPSRVFKGQHLPGRMGGEKTTIQSLEVIKVDKENALLVLKGSAPGPKNSYLLIKKAKKK